jgi:toxin CptA
MYNAPAVNYPVGRSYFQGVLMLAVVLAGALAQGVWWLQTDGHGVGHGLGLTLWLLSLGWVCWTVWHTPQQQLAWDGQEWRVHSGVLSRLVTPQVILDTQHSMLICMRPAAGLALWVWPAQKAQPERWLALRRALFNPASPEI